MKSDYQKEQEAASRRQERREKRAERRMRRALKQETASLLDKVALVGAQEKIQDTLEAERDEFLEREWYVRAGASGMCVPAKLSPGAIGTGLPNPERYTWAVAASGSRCRG